MAIINSCPYIWILAVDFSPTVAISELDDYKIIFCFSSSHLSFKNTFYSKRIRTRDCKLFI